MPKQSRKPFNHMLSRLETAEEALMTLRWAIDRTLAYDDQTGFSAIARIVLPVARTELERLKTSLVSAHIAVALDAIGYIEREVDRAIPTPSFDRLVAIADSSLESAASALEIAQGVIGAARRGDAREIPDSFRSRSV